ncbi:YdeI/OmpD-associated family protein [Agromyces indicus]|uniref:YdeI/OmpD-associated family protein n=1 Tax=Agromyces indicus TaxID=758919 RepID=A0ABU1FHR1_9MICO|nr:YdeI/OmpD-associated family protein [Agromyces indicus]MDR5691292.1 YdeI/OmpD-associated family protein [Agromyces indicus]
MPPDETAFVAPVEPVAWGRSTYTVIRIPEELADAARDAGTRRLEGTIDGVPVNLAVTRAPVVDGPFVWAGRSLLRRLGAEAGAPVECRLRPAHDDDVPVPADVAAELAARGVLQRWEGLPPADRRRRLYPIESAARPETRVRRIRALVEELDGGSTPAAPRVNP